MTKKLIYLLFLISFSFSVYSQGNRFINITREDGLASNFVRSIFQDSYGYMWFGTDYGLNRYDGVQMVTYRNIYNKDTSLANNYIQDIFQTSSNKLLIVSSDNIDVFNYKSETFDHINFIGNYSLKGVVETPDNKIWVITNNNAIIVLDSNLKFLDTINLTDLKVEDKISFNNLWIFKYDKNNLALYDEQFGFYLLDIKTKKLKLLSKELLPTSTTIFKIRSIGKSEFWVATLKGAFVFKNGSLFEVFSKGNTKNGEHLTSDFVLDIRAMPNNEIWLFTDGGGIDIYSKITKRFKYVKNAINDNYSLVSNFIFTTYWDKNSNLWLGTVKNGISQLDNSNLFTSYKLIVNDDNLQYDVPTSSLYMDSKNRIWAGSDGNGLYKLEGNEVEHVIYNSSIKTIPAIDEINSDKLILGTYKDGVSTFDVKNAKLTKQKSIDKNLNLDVKITFIKKTFDGTYWVGGNEIIPFRPKENQQLFNLDTEINNIKLRALSFAIHTKDTLLFGGTLGIYQYDEEGVKMISSTPKNIKQIIKFEKNTYWLGTSQGLCLFDIRSKKTTFFGTNDGLNTQEVNSLIADNSNNLWIGTDQGISKFDIKTKSFINYTYKDGFTDNSFQSQAVLKNKKGKMYFGGTKGILAFHPDSIKPRTNANKVVFTKIFVNHNELAEDDKTVLNKPIEEAPLITLSQKQKVVTINFSSFDFKHPEKIKFSYKLEGFDDEWRITTKRSLTYMNLSPGDYTLKIKASNLSSNWSNTDTCISIKVLPAWWQTIWFKLSVIVLILLVIYWINKNILKRAESKRVLEFEKKSLNEQKEQDEKQLQFFTNLSHEIRTPLSLILSPIETIIKDDEISAKTNNNLELIQKNALRIKKLIDRGIDFRKTQFKEPEIQASKQDMVSFLREITESFSSFSKSKNIELIFNSEKDEMLLWFDKYMTETIFYNLLSNAFKYSHPSGKIIVSITSDKDLVKIGVQDFGLGISTSDMDHVFERFFQAKDHIGGSGIGLALTKRFVEAHKGKINLNSELGKGSYFEVVFQLGNKHFDKSNLILKNREDKITIIKREPIEKEEHDYGQLKNYNILIVEDEENLRDYLRTNLAHYYIILTAGNGKEALEVVNHEKVDLIVSDVMMPEMDGMELCKILKENIKTSNIPIILLTAKALKEDKIAGYSTGADAYLEKPFQLDILSSRINNLLEAQSRQKKKMMDDLNIPIDSETINTSDEKFYKQSISIIEANIDNADFNIPMFSKELGMSKSLVYKKLAKITNLSINDLILSIRLQRASYMLIHTKKSIVDISLLVGFKNTKYFSTCFKKKFGQTPSNYRNEKRKLDNRLGN